MWLAMRRSVQVSAKMVSAPKLQLGTRTTSLPGGNVACILDVAVLFFLAVVPLSLGALEVSIWGGQFALR